MILAHVTHQRFPYWDWSWVWTTVAAVDANAQYLFGRYAITPPDILSSMFDDRLKVAHYPPHSEVGCDLRVPLPRRLPDRLRPILHNGD